MRSRDPVDERLERGYLKRREVFDDDKVVDVEGLQRDSVAYDLSAKEFLESGEPWQCREKPVDRKDGYENQFLLTPQLVP